MNDDANPMPPKKKRRDTMRRAALVTRVDDGPEPGTLREGPRRVLVAGAHRLVAISLIEHLLADPNVDAVLAVARGACPPSLLGADPERFHFVSADLSKRRQVDNLFLFDRFREKPLDTVVHMAFQGDPTGYTQRNHEFNVNATMRESLTQIDIADLSTSTMRGISRVGADLI